MTTDDLIRRLETLLHDRECPFPALMVEVRQRLVEQRGQLSAANRDLALYRKLHAPDHIYGAEVEHEKVG